MVLLYTKWYKIVVIIVQQFTWNNVAWTYKYYPITSNFNWSCSKGKNALEPYSLKPQMLYCFNVWWMSALKLLWINQRALSLYHISRSNRTIGALQGCWDTKPDSENVSKNGRSAVYWLNMRRTISHTRVTQTYTRVGHTWKDRQYT